MREAVLVSLAVYICLKEYERRRKHKQDIKGKGQGCHSVASKRDVFQGQIGKEEPRCDHANGICKLEDMATAPEEAFKIQTRVKRYTRRNFIRDQKICYPETEQSYNNSSPSCQHPKGNNREPGRLVRLNHRKESIHDRKEYTKAYKNKRNVEHRMGQDRYIVGKYRFTNCKERGHGQKYRSGYSNPEACPAKDRAKQFCL